MLVVEAGLGMFYSNRNYLTNINLDERFRTSTLSMFNFIRVMGTVFGFIIFGIVVDRLGINLAFAVPVFFSFIMTLLWYFSQD
jgi:hypothetical protein